MIARYSVPAILAEIKEAKARAGNVWLPYGNPEDREKLEKLTDWYMTKLTEWEDWIVVTRPKKADVEKRIYEVFEWAWNMDVAGKLQMGNGYSQITRGRVDPKDYAKLEAARRIRDMVQG